MRKNLVIVLNILSFIIAKAGTVTDLIDYQYYRDFAMNKGAFKVGAMNVRVDWKDGSYRIINVLIPDFSSTDSAGVGTLINPNYVAGVKHNGEYKNVSYGYELGLGKSYSVSNYKITPIFDTKLFTLPSNKYNLTDRHNNQYSVYSKKETLLQLKPSLTIEKSFNFNKLEILPSLTVGYEINKYLNNDNPEINVERIKFIAPMPKKGFEIKIGSTVKINENFNVGLEGKYLTGDEVKKKLSLELKFGYSL